MAHIDWKEADSPTHFLERSQKYQSLIQHVIKNNLLSDDTDSHIIDVFDLDAFNDRIDDLIAAFPEKHITHALAVKSQPLAGILKHAITTYPRLGLECASLEEAWLAHELGTPFNQIVYDSPVKSKQELEKAINHGFHINTDNQTEMETINEILQDPSIKTKSTFGLRINPIVGEGGLATSSTAGKGSKFGLIYCDETLGALVSLFKKYPWLQGLHCHVGSQGCSLDLISNGATTIYRAAERLNEALGKQQIDTLDIGGGVPTAYHTEEEAVSFMEYRKVLDAKVPEFFNGKYRVFTEFGRAVFAKYGTTLTHVASIKGSDENSDDEFSKYRGEQGQKQILLTYAGSNAFLREAYQMQTLMWRRRFTIYNKDGSIKTDDGKGNFCQQDIAGPMCFQGDYVCKDVSLPKDIQAGDILAIHDTGGYTYALYSHFNSRPAHAVYTAKKSEDGELELSCIKTKANMHETLAFWNYQQFKKDD